MGHLAKNREGESANNNLPVSHGLERLERDKSAGGQKKLHKAKLQEENPNGTNIGERWAEKEGKESLLRTKGVDAD